MKIVFLGTPKFGADILEGLIADGRDIASVVCQPDRPGNRNKIEVCPVKQTAQKHGVPVYQFEKISRDGAQQLKAVGADVFITAAYGQMLSEEILDIPKYGVFNAHGSLLPKYRGAAPVQYALLNGDDKTGITIMKTDVAMDSGDIAECRVVDITEQDNAATLLDKLAEQAVFALEKVLDDIESGQLVLRRQDDQSATYCGKITTDMSKIDWKEDSRVIFNKIRAFNPNPIAFTTLGGNNFKIYDSRVVDCDTDGLSGEVVRCDKNAVIVRCGQGYLKLLTMQVAGGKALGYKDLVNGRKIKTGDILGQ